MDERIHDHAAVLVDWSARIEPGDNVVVSVAEGAHELGVAVAEAVGERGGNLLAVNDSAELSRAYLQGRASGTTEFDSAPAHELALLEATDVYLRLDGGRNTAATADVPSEIRGAARRARTEVREARLATDWVSTVHPTRSLAQQAGMSFEAYQDFVYDAVLRDWESLADEMAQLKTILDEGEEVHIETPTTDLRLSIADRTAVNSAASVAYDSHNLPSGEVFTAPADAHGTITFDLPRTVDGTRLAGVELTIEDNEVVDYAADQGEETLGELLETDEGASRLGELGIGMNRGIDRLTDRILFDEKMAETVHLAIGRAYDACLPDGETGNDSAIHVDLLADMRTDSRLSVDGECIQRNGTFRWEEGFAATTSE
ncbi:MAG: aminopeptidase [Bacteroidales bacterium]|nr:aminopeptidase [Bacteroidales bacterium]